MLGLLVGFFYQELPNKFNLPGILDLGHKISQLGNGSCMWAVDLAHAYRQLRTCPLSVPLFGIKHNQSYSDIAPPFGCRTSALACARITSAVVHLMQKAGFFNFMFLR